MAQIAILANSKRPDGQCLAGIDIATGAWVRPVPGAGDGIPAAKCFVNGRFLELRDVLELELAEPGPPPKYQRENRRILNWAWRVTKRLRVEAVTRFVEDTVPILHSDNDRVQPAALDLLAPTEWKSLQLVEARNLTFGRHARNPNHWVTNFEDRGGNAYSLKITDPDVMRRLEWGQKISPRSLLTVSLTKPWTPDPAAKEPLCYKIVAAVIELS